MKLEVISRHPAGRAQPRPILFVHGMMHGAWCWDVHFLDYFARHGYASHAVNLRGHGNSEGREQLRWTRIADFVDDVVHAAAQLPAAPVLIGHSMGGFVVLKYLERHAAPGAVILSSPPPAGLLATTLRIARRHPLAFARTNLTFSLRPVVATPEMAREAFFSDDVPRAELLSYWRQMEDESYRALLDMVGLSRLRPGRVTDTPLLILGAERDNMLARAQIEATARAYHTRAEIVPGVAHNCMLEQRWEGVAERILDWLRAQVH